jgi:hypothetical protein
MHRARQAIPLLHRDAGRRSSSREESLTVARRAIGGQSGIRHLKVVLRLLFGEVTEKDMGALAAPGSYPRDSNACELTPYLVEREWRSTMMQCQS